MVVPLGLRPPCLFLCRFLGPVSPPALGFLASGRSGPPGPSRFVSARTPGWGRARSFFSRAFLSGPLALPRPALCVRFRVGGFAFRVAFWFRGFFGPSSYLTLRRPYVHACGVAQTCLHDWASGKTQTLGDALRPARVPTCGFAPSSLALGLHSGYGGVFRVLGIHRLDSPGWRRDEVGCGRLHFVFVPSPFIAGTHFDS